MPRCVLKPAGNGNAGRMDSQGSNLYPRYGTKPVVWRAIVPQDFELDAHIVRLRSGERESGTTLVRSIPRLHRRRQGVPAVQATQEGEMYHAF